MPALPLGHSDQDPSVLGVQMHTGLRFLALIQNNPKPQPGELRMNWMPWIPVVIAVLQVVKETMSDD